MLGSQIGQLVLTLLLCEEVNDYLGVPVHVVSKRLHVRGVDGHDNLRLGVDSDQLIVIALVGRYPTNKLMIYGLISMQEALRSPPFSKVMMPSLATFGFSSSFEELSPA